MIRYTNLGMAKSGTTSLWNFLKQSPALSDSSTIKEQDLFNANDYVRYNNQFSSTLDFNTHHWMLHSHLLKELSKYTTHSSIIFRNPYHYLNSFVNFTNTSPENVQKSLHNFYEFNYLNYTRITKRLKKFFPNLLILYYDDLVSDPLKFTTSICSFLEIPAPEPSIKKINVTNYTVTVPLSKNDYSKINGYIQRFSDYTKVDFSHWIINDNTN